MCGLVGVAGRINKKENDVFRDLLMVDVVRGPHSTGIAAMQRNDGDKLFKRALLPQDLFQMKGCDNLFNDFGMNKLLMGHNRWATVGKINAINAHPFERERIIGAHNGTLKMRHLLPDHNEFETDSENIFHGFETIGVKETLLKMNGAYALTWFEKGEGIFNVIRNDERSLFYTFINDDKTFVYASEAWMIEGVLARNGFKHGGILPFEPMYHYTLEIPANETKPFDKFHMSAVEGYTAPKSNTGNRWSGSPSQQRLARNGTTTSGGNTGSSQNVTDLTANGGVTSDLKKPSTGTGGDSANGGTFSDHYETGDIVAFRVMANSIEAESRFLYGRDVFNANSKLKIYLVRGAVLRKQMSEDAAEWWAGVINGKDKNGYHIIQGNSVAKYDELPDDQFQQLQENNAEHEKKLRERQLDELAKCNGRALEEADQQSLKLQQQEEYAAKLASEDDNVDEDGFLLPVDGITDVDDWGRHCIFIAGVGRCGWCNETLNPTEDNLIVNSQAVFCPGCRKIDDLQQFFPNEDLF
ncbi:MAG: hypothetical protein GY800_06690 [Planctomycetes bacterium]|nr:hypothetical protein [Planctomycetota bacterium]